MPPKKTAPNPPPTRRIRKPGQSLVEYTLILGGLSLAVWGALMLLGDSVSDRLTGVSDELTDANTNYFTRFNLSVAPISNADKTDANSKFDLLSRLHFDFFNNNAEGGQKSSAASFSSTGLTLRDVNGGEMNVSSAEGIRIRTRIAKTLKETAVVSQGLFELAAETNSSSLQDLAQQALLSASLQATYQTVTDPSNPTNANIKDLTKITAQNYYHDELAGNPKRVLLSIEDWNKSMQQGKAAIKKDKQLTVAQQTQAISLIDEMIQSTRQAYDLKQLTTQAQPLNNSKLLNNEKTFTQLYAAAEKALESDLTNQALETTLTNGITLEAVH